MLRSVPLYSELTSDSTQIYFQKCVDKAVIRIHLMITLFRLLCTKQTLQSARRRMLLKHLSAYVRQGHFPRNTYAPGTFPIFRDESGTLCAMGYLAWADGQTNLVERTVRADNFINLSDNVPEQFQAWLDRASLTPSEAARVQPSYGFYPYPEPSEPTWPLFLLWILLALPVYICLIGTYLVLGKKLLDANTLARRVLNLTVILAVLCMLAALPFAWWYLNNQLT